MQMEEYKTPKELAEETIIYAGEMDPMDRNDFIDLICFPLVFIDMSIPCDLIEFVCFPLGRIDV